MADILTELRNALATLSGATFGPDFLPTDEMLPRLKSAGAVYAFATREVNERLSKCEQLLRSGQRSEAIRQALFDPDLLKRFAELDIPARTSWSDFAGRNGLPAPATLDNVAATRLNQAFSLEKVVEPLLQQYRTLALARAPMQKRLDLLRLLVKAEPACVAWVEDLTRFEQFRHDEIRLLAARVRQKRDWDLATQLADEVQSPNWATKPPLDVIDAVLRSRDELLRQEGQRCLTVLAVRMRTAIRTPNLQEAEEIEAEVYQALKQYRLAENDPLVESHQEGFAWIRNENKKLRRIKSFNKSEHTLLQAIRDGHDWWYILQCYREASAYDIPLREEILTAFHKAKRKRATFQRILVLGIGTLLIAGVVGYFIWKS